MAADITQVCKQLNSPERPASTAPGPFLPNAPNKPNANMDNQKNLAQRQVVKSPAGNMGNQHQLDNYGRQTHQRNDVAQSPMPGTSQGNPQQNANDAMNQQRQQQQQNRMASSNSVISYQQAVMEAVGHQQRQDAVPHQAQTTTMYVTNSMGIPNQVGQQQRLQPKQEPGQQNQTVVMSVPSSMGTYQTNIITQDVKQDPRHLVANANPNIAGSIEQQQLQQQMIQQANLQQATVQQASVQPGTTQMHYLPTGQQVSGDWRIQLVPHPMQNPTYVPNLYNPQGQILMPGNITLPPGINPNQIQFITTDKALQNKQAGTFTSLPTIPTTQNQTFYFSPVNVMPSQSNIAPTQTTSVLQARPDGLKDAKTQKEGTETMQVFNPLQSNQQYAPWQQMWAGGLQQAQFVGHNPIFIQSVGQPVPAVVQGDPNLNLTTAAPPQPQQQQQPQPPMIKPRPPADNQRPTFNSNSASTQTSLNIKQIRPRGKLADVKMAPAPAPKQEPITQPTPIPVQYQPIASKQPVLFMNSSGQIIAMPEGMTQENIQQLNNKNVQLQQMQQQYQKQQQLQQEQQQQLQQQALIQQQVALQQQLIQQQTQQLAAAHYQQQMQQTQSVETKPNVISAPQALQQPGQPVKQTVPLFCMENMVQGIQHNQLQDFKHPTLGQATPEQMQQTSQGQPQMQQFQISQSPVVQQNPMNPVPQSNNSTPQQPMLIISPAKTMPGNMVKYSKSNSPALKEKQGQKAPQKDAAVPAQRTLQEQMNKPVPATQASPAPTTIAPNLALQSPSAQQEALESVCKLPQMEVKPVFQANVSDGAVPVSMHSVPCISIPETDNTVHTVSVKVDTSVTGDSFIMSVKHPLDPPPPLEPLAVPPTSIVSAITTPITTSQIVVPSKPSIPTQFCHQPSDKNLPKAMVKPNTLTHVIDGFVIQEASEPFAVMSPRERNADNALREREMLNNANSQRGDLDKCEVCGKLLKNLKRFCSVACSRGQRPVNKTLKEDGTPESQSQSSQSPAVNWSVGDVCDFIKQIPNSDMYCEDFVMHEIDGKALLLIEPEHLVQAMKMKLGPALKIVAAIDALRPDKKKSKELSTIDDSVNDVTDASPNKRMKIE